MSDSTSKRKRKNEKEGSLGFILILIVLSFDREFSHLLPNWVGSIPRYIVVIFAILQAYRAYRITRIPELLAVTTVLIFAFIHLPYSSFNDRVTLSNNFSDTLFTEIITNLVVISLIIPWSWISYQMISTKIPRISLIASTSIVFPIVLIGQFSERWAGTLFMVSIIFLSLWFLIANILIQPFYNSKLITRGKWVVTLASLMLLIPFVFLALHPTTFTLSLAYFGIDAWLILIYYAVTSYPHTFFLTQEQTTRAAGSFYDLKLASEKIDCMIYDNVDRYLRNIPEENVLGVDNDKLTLMWIGLQRNDR